MSEYKDITYVLGANAVRITINRPEVFNAFRTQTVEELILAFRRADEEPSVNTVIFTGAGEKAFCTGGDQKVHLSEDGLYGPRGMVGFPIEELQTAIRDCRKVVIARVQGFAIGGGSMGPGGGSGFVALTFGTHFTEGTKGIRQRHFGLSQTGQQQQREEVTFHVGAKIKGDGPGWSAQDQ